MRSATSQAATRFISGLLKLSTVAGDRSYIKNVLPANMQVVLSGHVILLLLSGLLAYD